MVVRMHARALWRSVAVAALFAAAIAIASDAGVSGAGSPGIEPVLHVPVLLYHRVMPVAEAGNSLPNLVVSPAEFATQMDALKANGWHSVTAARLADYLEASATPPARTFVITIDDGTDDGYTYAYPILREHGFVASYFVVAGRIGSPHDLDASQLRTLASAGNEIANHSMSHIHLSRRTRAELAPNEIDSASDAIAAITGQRPVTFAYPFGDRDTDVVAAVGACPGLRMALTTAPGASETWSGRFEVPRLTVVPATRPADLVARMERAG